MTSFQSADGVRILFAVAGTTQVTTVPGIVNRLIVSDMGTLMTVDIYDAISANTSPVYRYVSADEKVSIELNCPIRHGLRVVIGGTAGEVSVIYGQHER